jgi:hypothetical protein
MSRLNLRDRDTIDQLKRFISFRLSKKLGIGTLVFDPAGDNLIFLLDVAEREFGRVARDELFEFLEPYHKQRVLKTLQSEAIKQKLWLAAADLSKNDDEDDDFDVLSLFDEGGE